MTTLVRTFTLLTSPQAWAKKMRSACLLLQGESLGRRLGFNDAAGFEAEGPHVDARWLDAQRCEGGADLAPMVGSVVQSLGESDADRGIPRVTVIVYIPQHGVGVRLQGQELGPRPFVGLHRCPQLPK